MKSAYKNLFKPVLDFLLALFLLIIASPIIIFVSIILFISNKGEIFFIQKRPGKNEQIFSLIKFKTMNNKNDETGVLLPVEKRLTKIGSLMRKFSIDELLQFVNVLKGNMSLIGPRPLLIEYLPLYNDHQRKRHNVKPGITGWAQVNGRNSLSWEDKFNYDVWYVENITFLLDVKIFMLTLLKIFKKEGINSDTPATMEKFRGNN